MKTMIEIERKSDGTSNWISLDSIIGITSYEDHCAIWTNDGEWCKYQGTIEHLTAKINASTDLRGEIRLIKLDGTSI